MATKNGRSKKISLITPLTDPGLWPLAVLAALYARRWRIELFWDDSKTTRQMDRLSCKSPDRVHKEMEMHFIAYNLIRSVMAEAAQVCHVPLDRMSFKGGSLERAVAGQAKHRGPAEGGRARASESRAATG